MNVKNIFCWFSVSHKINIDIYLKQRAFENPE